MTSLLYKLRCLWRRGRKEEELQEELEFHLAEEAAESDRDTARRTLGNLTLLREETRAAWTWSYLEQFLQDCRYALRTMRAKPAFSALAILSLALGIGANTAIFSFLYSILLRTVPVREPSSLVTINWRAPGRKSMRGTVVHSGSGEIYKDGPGATSAVFPYPVYELLHKPNNSLAGLFAYCSEGHMNLLVQGQAVRAGGELVTGDYFAVLGVAPSAGRLLVPDDDHAGAPPVVVLSYAFSRSRFGDPASAAGQTVQINNTPFTVAGVTPPSFTGIDPSANPDFYVALQANIARNLDEHFYWLEMAARLRPGVSRRQAQAGLAPLFHGWVDSTATTAEERAALPALLLEDAATGVDRLRRQYSEPLYLLLAMVGLILVVACANIANLLLALAAARRREMAVRLSIGASRSRIIRQLLTESLLLSCSGGLLGIGFAFWGIRFLTHLLANGSQDYNLYPHLNTPVLGAALALSVLTGLLFGLAPALQATRGDILPELKLARAGHSRFRAFGLGRLLLVAQIGFSLLILVGSGLFTRTLSNLQAVRLGFQPDHLLLFQMDARHAGHDDPEIIDFYQNLLARFRAIPGVKSASASHWPMIGHGSWFGTVAPLSGEPKTDVTTNILQTGTDFFRTMQIPVLLGRPFDERDRPGSPSVAIVNEEYARTYFGDRNPIGEHILISRPGPRPAKEVEIVGVARNARYGDLKGAFPPVAYVPFNQGSYVPVEEMTFVLRTAADPLALTNSVREIVRAADARIPLTDVKTEAAQIDQTMSRETIFAEVCTAFALLALAIACVGLYGTMSYTVARRTGEIGIRMALGAQRGSVIWMVLREVLALAAIALAVGVPAALGASKYVESFLYGVKPNDPLALTAAAAILVTSAILAGYVPARKAARIDPMTAVRHE